eukprot:s4420_g2.t1
MAEMELTLTQELESEMNQIVQESVQGANGVGPLSPMPSAPAADPPAGEGGAEAAVAEVAKCAKCKTESKVAEMICRPSFRVELRHVCRPKGVQLTELLNEDSLVAFFSECALEKKHAEDGRLSFARARATLKKCMVQEVRHSKRDSQDAEWQPLSYWELKGYDVDRIQATCPHEDNPALGKTYKVAIHKESDETLYAQAEQRITQMESDAQQRRTEAASAPGVPALELDEAIEAAAAVKGKRKGGLTESEKEEQKNLKKLWLTESEKEEQKNLKKLCRQRETERKVATAAAAKMLPTLKTCLDKLETNLERLKDASLPCATLDQAVSARDALQTTAASATKLLNAAASGKPLEGFELDFKKEKDLQSKVKDGNAAVRALQDFVRAQNGNKENAKPGKGKGKGRGKKDLAA